MGCGTILEDLRSNFGLIFSKKYYEANKKQNKKTINKIKINSRKFEVKFSLPRKKVSRPPVSNPLPSLNPSSRRIGNSCK